MRYDAVAHLNPAGAPTVTLFTDDVTAVPAGQARAVIRHTAAAAPLDVQLGSTVTATGLANGSSSDVVVPAGAYELTVSTGSAASPLLPSRTVSLPEGTATFMYLIGSADANTLDWLAVQATGLQSAPTKVPTGDGSVTQPPTESNGSGREVAGLGAVAVFFAIATILRLRRA